MVEQMIETVRAAFAPGADPTTKQQAAAILRAALNMLEPGNAAAPALMAPDTVEAPVSAGADLLTRIVEYIRPHLPPEVHAEMPRFRVPLLNYPKNG